MVKSLKSILANSVIYEIVKSSTQADLQRIFIPNTSELDILHYIDTQVTYDDVYRYEIYAHQLIVGTQYNYVSYTDLTQYMTGNRKAVQFGVNYGPSLKIARKTVKDKIKELPVAIALSTLPSTCCFA